MQKHFQHWILECKDHVKQVKLLKPIMNFLVTNWILLALVSAHGQINVKLVYPMNYYI